MEGAAFLEWFKSNGPWAVLFVALFVYVLRTTDRREQRLLNALDALAEKYTIIDVVRKDVEDIKRFIFHGKED